MLGAGCGGSGFPFGSGKFGAVIRMRLPCKQQTSRQPIVCSNETKDSERLRQCVCVCVC